MSFVNFLRMPPGMFDELLERVGPRISKQRTAYRALEAGFDTAPPSFRFKIRGHAVCLEGATEHYLPCCEISLSGHCRGVLG